MERRLSKTGSKNALQKKSSKSQLSARSSTIKKSQPVVKTSTAIKKKEFDLPAFSVSYVPSKAESEFDKLKKKTIRRNAPPGEDLKHIKSILRSIKGQPMTVQEFIALIAPSTGDKGETMRIVMNEDLNAFRKLARKVYETITQDNSDVLLNQQLQLTEYHKEKKKLLQIKMMKTIEEIYMMAPNFDFYRYSKEKERYLTELFPVPEEIQLEPEEMELLKRQAAYHRLQWLLSEGERLAEENNSLKQRLKQLKRMHLEFQNRKSGMEKAAEEKKQALEVEEAEKLKELEVLNKSLEESIIKQEILIKQEEDREKFNTKQSTGATKKILKGGEKKKVPLKKKRSKPAWNEQVAKELEERALEEQMQSEKKKIRSPFHFSPIKTPPGSVPTAKELSPFHYSPHKNSVEEAALYLPPPPQKERQPEQHQFGRRGNMPKDQWGGFY